MTKEAKINELDSYILQLAIDRGWGVKNNSTIHHPNGQFIQIDMDELYLVRELLKKDKNYFECATLMVRRIYEHLFLDNKLNYFKDIEIQFFDSTNGKRYHTIIL